MKKILMIVLCGLAVGVFSATAQHKFRSIVDPSFSADNYKHPNKAAAARKENPPSRLVIPAYNYRQMRDLWTARTAYSYKNFKAGRFAHQGTLVLPGNRLKNYTNPLRNPDHYKVMHSIRPSRQEFKLEDAIMVDTHEKRDSDD